MLAEIDNSLQYLDDVHETVDKLQEKIGKDGMNNYKRVDQELPPEGELVDTISPSGIVQQMRRKGRLWFFDDMSAYVYFTPEFWRPIR